MTMPGFTAGPWESDGAEIYAPSHEWVAESLNVKDYPRAYANARLISASPDLYEALRDFLAVQWVHEKGTPWLRCQGMLHQDVLRLARAALAKAEGRDA